MFTNAQGLMGLKLEASKGVEIGDDKATLLNRRNDSIALLRSQSLVLSESEVGAVKVLVDDADHAVLAVLAGVLGAVVPDGLLVLDDDLEDVGGLALGSEEVEAREEGGAVGQGVARVAKVGLGDGVVAGQVVPLDDVAHLGDDVVRVEAEAAEAGDYGVGDARELVGAGRGLGAGGVGGSGGDGGGGGQEDGGEGLDGEHFV
ncbi:extracellular serine-rich protein [Colletotrichum scovillei]|uniref:Extracellular serine-rich protein n=1 Tax=Colletotrichum scovillei TaxID=1209932 RepID=A0A9P7RAT0_9PEZI|nr:extracellular serine-rich protein [Colletotrichum scovillei]KAG7071928.1 extracellular serine-rich protein [Colletotrichum scovillei]KAG7080175.1 extracellular serine-rich protein [Colletotrichum scovillei]